MDFKTNDSLMNAIRNEMNNSALKVAEYVEREVKMSVSSNVYDAWGPPKEYERTGQFYESWTYKLVEKDKNKISYQISSDPERMIWNPGKFQHGNESTDRRQFLDAAIQEGYGYDLISYSNDTARDYWSSVEIIIDDGTLDKVVEGSLRSAGLNFIKN